MSLFGPPDPEKLLAKGDVDGLVKLLGYQKDWEVRRSAALALGRMGTPGIDRLIIALADPEPGVRCLCAEALGRAADGRAVEPLILALGDPSEHVRQAAATALGAIGDPRAIEPLLVVCGRPGSVGYGDREKMVRDSAALALRPLRRAHLDPFIAALSSEDQSRREMAASLIVSHPADGRVEARLLEPLLAALEDSDSEVVNYACAGLGSIGDPRAFVPLIARLADPDSRVRYTAGRAILQIGEPAIESLVAALEDQSPVVRTGAAELLNVLRWPGPEPFSELRWQPEADATGARYWAARGGWDACVNIGAPAVAPLIECLVEHDTMQPAQRALVEIGPPAVEPLIAALGSKAWQIRWGATEALGQIGDPRAIDPLRRTLASANGYDRERTVRALERLGVEVDLAAVSGAVAEHHDPTRHADRRATEVRETPSDPTASVEPAGFTDPLAVPSRPAKALRVNLGDVPRESLESVVRNGTALTIAQDTAMDVITPELASEALTAKAHEARADSLAQRGDFEAAALAYQQAIESAPYADEILYMSLGGVLSELRRHAQALANLEVAVQINPANEDVVRNLAICRKNVDAEATR
jgi:HEAT repeat protein